MKKKSSSPEKKNNPLPKAQQSKSQKPKCFLHNNTSEGYCRDCDQFICSKCIFSSPNVHKSHSFLSLDELAMFLRELIDKNSEILKSGFYEVPNLNIKEAKFAIRQNAQKLIDQVNDDSEKLIEIINSRKENLENIIKEQVDEQIKIVEQLENKWKQKINLIKEINKIQINRNDEVVYNNLSLIIKGIEFLKEPMSINSYKQITDYDLNIAIKESTLAYLNENKINNRSYKRSQIGGSTEENKNNTEEEEEEKIRLGLEDLCEILNNMFVVHEEDMNDYQFKA